MTGLSPKRCDQGHALGSSDPRTLLHPVVRHAPFRQKLHQRRWANSSVTQQHVEDVVALLTAGFGRSRSSEGRALGWRDAIPVDHPGTLLDAAGDQVLRLGWRGGMAINDVAAGGEAGGAEKTEAQCQSG